jgi:hypothetical protein
MCTHTLPVVGVWQKRCFNFGHVLITFAVVPPPGHSWHTIALLLICAMLLGIVAERMLNDFISTLVSNMLRQVEAGPNYEQEAPAAVAKWCTLSLPANTASSSSSLSASNRMTSGSIPSSGNSVASGWSPSSDAIDSNEDEGGDGLTFSRLKQLGTLNNFPPQHITVVRRCIKLCGRTLG